jgi:hypothetical protein
LPSLLRPRPWCLQAWSLSSAQGADDAPLNTLTAAEKAAGWKLLFDGKSLDGWRKFKGKEPGDRWQAINGVLAFDPAKGKSGGDIITVEQFDNFELVLEWKISKGGNSGVMYRVTEERNAPYETGPEYQLLDNKGHGDGRNPLTAAASAYAVYAPAKDVTKPIGEWNQTKIIVNGSHVEHWLNGEKVVEYEFGSEDWLKRVKSSKWKDVPTYGKAAKGHIDLQDHGDKVEFRNIKIRALPGK